MEVLPSGLGKELEMMIPPNIPPPHPDAHLRHEKNRNEAAERDARSGRRATRAGTLSTGDKIIFLVLGIASLAGLWFLFAWLSS
jgi:hypothetical protein